MSGPLKATASQTPGFAAANGSLPIFCAIFGSCFGGAPARVAAKVQIAVAGAHWHEFCLTPGRNL
jgi:hypothetical protein